MRAARIRLIEQSSLEHYLHGSGDYGTDRRCLLEWEYSKVVMVCYDGLLRIKVYGINRYHGESTHT